MENHSEKIQDYIEGHLEGDDLVQFEERLKVDDELRNLLSLQREVYDILNKRTVSKEVELRSSLDTISNNFRHDINAKVINFKRIISFTAAACILIVGSVFVLKYTDKDLYELPTLHSEVVRGADVNASYEDAIRFFNQKEYTESRRQLEILSEITPSQVQYSYYIGLTYIGDKNWNKAIDLLGPIATGESVFSDEATYYLAIAYYEKGDSVKAISLLRKIESHAGFTSKVKELLDKIN